MTSLDYLKRCENGAGAYTTSSGNVPQPDRPDGMGAADSLFVICPVARRAPDSGRDFFEKRSYVSEPLSFLLLHEAM